MHFKSLHFHSFISFNVNNSGLTDRPSMHYVSADVEPASRLSLEWT